MNLSFHWINLAILFGAVQGLVITIILLLNRKHPGSRFLASFIFVLAYNGFETFNWSAGLDKYYLFFDMFGFVVIYGLGPSLYLYVKSLLNPEHTFKNKTIILHYGVVIFQFTTRLLMITYHILWINKIIVSEISSMQLMAIVWWYAEPLSVILFLIYLFASIQEYNRAKQKGKISSLGKEGTLIVLRWLHSLLVCLCIFALAWVLTVAVPYFVKLSTDFTYYPIELALVLFIYWFAFTGYHKTKVIYLKPTVQPARLSGDEPDPNFARLMTAMQSEKLYLDPELNLGKLAMHTGIPAKSISSLLNQQHQTTFNDFVNRYRVLEVCDLILRPGNQQLTISGIAYDAGFNSQATFQRAFRKQTGMSPTEYLNSQTKKVG